MKLHYINASKSASKTRKGSEIQKMSTQHKQQICLSIARQGGFMPSVWSLINASLNYDRTPETSGFLEDRVS